MMSEVSARRVAVGVAVVGVVLGVNALTACSAPVETSEPAPRVIRGASSASAVVAAAAPAATRTATSPAASTAARSPATRAPTQPAPSVAATARHATTPSAGTTLKPAAPVGSSPVPAAATVTRVPSLGDSALVGVDAMAAALLPRPVLVNPVTQTINPTWTSMTLDVTRDYVIKVKPGAVLSKPVTLVGGRNVVIESQVLRYAAPVGAAADWKVRGLLLKGATGTTWVRDLQIRGPLAEGIDLDQRAPRSTVVLRDIAIDKVSGSYAGNHADLLQTWAGPDRLVVDGLTGSSDYQGMFLRPTDAWADGPMPSFFSLRNISMDLSTGYYALWSDGYGAFPIAVRNVSVRPNPARPGRDAWLWPKPSTGDTTWQAVSSRG